MSFEPEKKLFYTPLRTPELFGEEPCTPVKESGRDPIVSRVFRPFHGSSIPENGSSDWIQRVPPETDRILPYTAVGYGHRIFLPDSKYLPTVSNWNIAAFLRFFCQESLEYCFLKYRSEQSCKCSWNENYYLEKKNKLVENKWYPVLTWSSHENEIDSISPWNKTDYHYHHAMLHIMSSTMKKKCTMDDASRRSLTFCQIFFVNCYLCFVS